MSLEAGPHRIAAIVLAGGRSSRMGRENKLLMPFKGVPLIRHAVLAAVRSQAQPVCVVLGQDADKVRTELEDFPVTFSINLDFMLGLSTSLRTGLKQLPAITGGALICLGDMPLVTAAHLDRLIAGFDPEHGRGLVVPTFKGTRGNPVLWASCYFPELDALTGDQGAKSLFSRHPEALHEVEMPDDSVLIDIDTPERLAEVERA